MTIGDSYKFNFDTIKAAAENKDLCLLEIYDRLTGEPSVALCAGYEDDKGELNIVPLALMFSANPYEDYVNDPDLVAKYAGTDKRIIRLNGGPEGCRSENGNPESSSKHELMVSGMLLDHLGIDQVDRIRKLTPLFVKEVLEKVGGEWSIAAKELDDWIDHAENPARAKEGQDGQNGQDRQDGQSNEAPEPGEAP